jgi:D-alanine-D-alanine ligase
VRRRIGLVFELRGSLAEAAPGAPALPADADVEYEPEETIAALESALRSIGCEPVRLGGPRDLLRAGRREALPPVDAALDLAEGYGTRNREAWAPVLLEMLGIPCLGSDALTLSLCLDKAWASRFVAAAGVAIPEQWTVGSDAELESLSEPMPYPLFVKPRWEGTSKGIGTASRVGDRAALAAAVARVVATYGQPALVERFLPGPEYTVTLVGHDPPRALPVLQRALDPATGIGAHALRGAGVGEPVVSGSLDAALESALAEASLCAYRALRCLDFARADWKLDAEGAPRFLEMNPLPTFAPDGSFAILAELEGSTYEALVGSVLRDGLGRLGL